MTAARSDLMALDPLEMLLDAARFADSIKPEWAKAARKAVAAARLAASQPDREAIKASLRELDTLIREYDVTNSDWAFRSSVMLTEVAKILSLLSGAGAKSDGGVEGHAISSTGPALEQSRRNLSF